MRMFRPMTLNRKNKTAFLRSALLLVTILLILSVILSPVITAVLFLVGAGLIALVIRDARRGEKVRIKSRHTRSVNPGRSPPFFF